MGDQRCPTCSGTGHGRRGAPCWYCHGSGRVRGVAAVASTLNEFAWIISTLILAAIAIVMVASLVARVIHG